MTDDPTKAEIGLAMHAIKLQEAKSRPRVDGLGILGDVLNFVGARVPIPLVRIGLILILVYFAWDFFARAEQMVANLETKRAEASKMIAEADAANARIRGDSVELAKLKAELEKLKAEAATAKADYEANAQIINGIPARLTTLRAEIENTQAEADKAQYELDAQNKSIDGIPITIAQKKASVEELEAKAGAAFSQLKTSLDIHLKLMNYR